MAKFILTDEEATLQLGARLARACGKEGAVIFLHGTLGAGKTTLARGFLGALGHSGRAKSPTYTLVEPYLLEGQQVYHFDFYRLSDPCELEFIGIQDYFSPATLCLVEWPERGAGRLPLPDLRVSLGFVETDGRSACLQTETQRGKILLRRFIHSTTVIRCAEQTNSQ